METILKAVPVGMSFKAFGHNWTVLEKNNDFCFCICNELVTKMPFSKYDTENSISIKAHDIIPNDFRSSEIREFLNNEFFAELVNEGAYADNDIFPLTKMPKK